MGLLGSLGSLNVLLSADTAQFSSAMDKAAYSAEKNFKKIGISAKLGFAALAAALIANTKSAFDFVQSMDNMSKRLGITATQMSILAYAAKMSNIEVGSLETAMGKMIITAYKTPQIFENIGVKVRDSSGKMRDVNKVFTETLEALRKMPDGAGKAAASVLVFGKTGRDIMPLFSGGVESIKEFEKAARSLGVVLEEESVKTAERLDKAWKKSTEGIKGFGIAFMNAITEAFDVIVSADLKKLSLWKSWEKFISQTNAAAKASGAAAEADKKRTEALADQTLAFEQLAAAAEKHKKFETEGQKLTESLRTAQEIYNDELIKYNELLDAGAISNETFERGLKKAGDTFTENTKKASKLNDITKDLGFTFVSAFEDAIIEGKKFGEVIVSLGKDIERLLLRKLVTERLADALGAGISSFFSPRPSSAITGGVGGQTIQTQQFGQTWSPYASAKGNVFSGNRLIPFANGGLIDRPSIFPMANGGVGLAGEKGTEAILPLFRTGSGDLGVKSGSGGGVEINVYAPPGSKVSQNSQRSGDKDMINIMIDEAVAGSVNSPGSKTYKAMRGTFGLKQSLNAR